MSKLLPDADYFVRYFPKPLPKHINGFCTVNDDTTYCIFIDPSKPEEKQVNAFKHELRHLEADDFSVGVDPVEAEKRCG